MLTLKDYQQRALDTLREYLRLAQRQGSVNTAFYSLTLEKHGQGVAYHPIDGLREMPYVCLRLPTGGGKTLLACHAIGIAARDLLHADHAVVLWLAPSNVIRDQTLRALSDPDHPYRQALEAAVGPITVLGVSDALYVQPSTLNSSTTVIVATIQAFRVDNTEGRKVYESSGALMSHFTDLPEELKSGLELNQGGEPKKSLANVLYMRRPIVIVDEAHNARTPLSFETLARFHPSCILEFTATPATQDHPSNVLYYSSAAELKAEAMIKMPIRLRVREDWKEQLSDAIAQRNQLELVAKIEQRQTGEYLRPIMLLQAQPRSQHRKTLTYDVIRQTLMLDFKISETQIAIATGDLDEIEDIDLTRPDCPIRYIITVQALREGWDCPFAYVLCSVAESKSSTAVEQIIGRVLRLPKATAKHNIALNFAYVFSTSKNVGDIVEQLKDGLTQNGFQSYEAQAMIEPLPEAVGLPLFDTSPGSALTEPVSIVMPNLPALQSLPTQTAEKLHYDEPTKSLVITKRLNPEEAIALTSILPQSVAEASASVIIEKATVSPSPIAPVALPAQVKEAFSVPQLVVRRGERFEPFEETVFLDVPWRLSQCDTLLTEEEYSGERFDGTEVEYDVTAEGKLKVGFINDLQHAMTLFAADAGWTPAELVYWLDRNIPHTDVSFREANAFLSILVLRLMDERGFSLDQLVSDKYHLRDAVAEKINTHRIQARKQAYNLFLDLDSAPLPLEVNPEICFTYPHYYPYNSLYRGVYPFQKHYYKEVGDLQEKGEEFRCAVYLDKLPEVKYWVRNLERRPNHSFWLQTATDRFYPDFVCLLHDGRYLAVEYKGTDRWTNEDLKEKRTIGEVWQKHSGGKCLFIMPKGEDYEAIKHRVLTE